ncbi:hypothetical protein ACRAWC_23790 [Leifsonia sp. L25]|uniref:hypothetical protein n=1 Tax=Leifsonia sp. L25 TaxID=3423957 RepID=UPI003D68C7B2
MPSTTQKEWSTPVSLASSTASPSAIAPRMLLRSQTEFQPTNALARSAAAATGPLRPPG